MNKYAKIGIIAGAVGMAAMAVKKAFGYGFSAGMITSFRAAGMVIDEMENEYNSLADNYNALEEDYCDLLDELDMSLEEDIAVTEK